MTAFTSERSAVPELFFSGGALTIVTVGFFFTLENPADFFRQKIQVDALTGATITSRAVCSGVNAALSVAAALG